MKKLLLSLVFTGTSLFAESSINAGIDNFAGTDALVITLTGKIGTAIFNAYAKANAKDPKVVTKMDGEVANYATDRIIASADKVILLSPSEEKGWKIGASQQIGNQPSSIHLELPYQETVKELIEALKLAGVKGVQAAGKLVYKTDYIKCDTVAGCSFDDPSKK
jgi:sulfur carrier protein ThiS